MYATRNNKGRAYGIAGKVPQWFFSTDGLRLYPPYRYDDGRSGADVGGNKKSEEGRLGIK